MKSGRADDPDRDVVVCADILGSFGVTPDDVRAQRREYRSVVPPGQGERSLEPILADVLADARDRTTTVQQLISESDRGLTCSARYAQRALGRDLEAVFAAIGWSFDWTRTGPAENGRDRLELVATDPKGRSRETTVTYPETPLADDNLPAVLQAVDERLLAGTDATVVLLSTGADRWRAALIEQGELEALRERYGQRIEAFDRPLLPADGFEAYVPNDGTETGGDGSRTGSEDGPWPEWALERAERRSGPMGGTDESGSTAATTADSQGSVESLIEEAEPETEPASATTAESQPSTSPPSSEAGGFEIRGGSPTVSRLNDDASTDASPRDVADSMLEAERERTVESGTRDEQSRTEESGEDDGFGTLSGTTKTARVTNDSFGTGEGFETDDDRYRALGAALGAGGRVSVEGLLEDDEFLPELPASGPTEARIEFADSFDPDAVPEATASAERDGFEWVDSGSLETTRVSDH